MANALEIVSRQVREHGVPLGGGCHVDMHIGVRDKNLNTSVIFLSDYIQWIL